MYAAETRSSWKEMVQSSWTNEELLRRINGEKINMRTIRKKIGNWIGHILRRNCLQMLLTEGR